MYVEGDTTRHETPRMAANRLMHELDNAAAQNGHRVIGDVTILATQPDPFGISIMRIEADVTPAV